MAAKRRPTTSTSHSIGLTNNPYMHYPDKLWLPKRVEKPATVEDLKNILAKAYRHSWKVKAFGSGHSSSDAAMPPDILVDTSRLKGIKELDHMDVSRADLARGERLYRVGAGTKISDLNDALHRRNHALKNMGNFDGQSIYGAICTGTHGSNLSMGPIADQVVSLDLVTLRPRNGKPTPTLVRIEPRGGVTNKSWESAGPDRELIQKNSVFYASVVSMGTLGVGFAVTLVARPRYKLHETHKLVHWDDIKTGLPNRVQKETPFYEILLGPNKPHKEDGCIAAITRRREVASSRHNKKTKPFFAWLGKAVVGGAGAHAGDHLGKSMSKGPGLTNRAIRNYSKGQAINWSYNIFPLGYGTKYRAWSNEISVPLNRARKAVGIVLGLARKLERKDIYHAGPVGIRFVGPSKHYLAMQYGRNTCTIETTLIVGAPEHETTLKQIERKLREDVGGRPHWGQWNTITRAQARKLYPRYDDFLKVYRDFNRYGVFNNAFTHRVFGNPSA